MPIPSSLSPGTYTVSVSYGGDGNYSASSTPITFQVKVGLIAPTVTVVSSLNPILVTSAITFTATVSSSGTPTGSVSFYDGTTLLGTVTLSQGTAAYTTSSLAAGNHSITATYSGRQHLLLRYQLSRGASRPGLQFGRQRFRRAAVARQRKP